MTPFIRVTEMWVPSPDRTVLVYGGGLYGPLAAFKGVSEETRFAYGEGLPGRSWAERAPIVLKDLETSYFRRGEAAKAAGLSCGVALPVFAGDMLLAVVVFFCGSDEPHAGAIEVWQNDPAASGQMTLVDGYYGTAELFQRASGTAFGRGHGLPGQAWETGTPVYVPELYRSTRLLRPELDMKVGASTGIGIPLRHAADRSFVMTFLSASGTPIARRFDTWLASPDRDRLVREARPDDDPATYRTDTLGLDDGPVGRMLITGLPLVTTALSADAPLAPATVAAEGLTSLVALPVLTEEGRVAAVASWYF